MACIFKNRTCTQPTDFQKHILTDVSQQHFVSIGVSNFASGYAGCYWEWCDTTRGAGGLW